MFGDPAYVLDRIPKGARVLDVGGGLIPLARADVVLDVVERPTGPIRCIEGVERTFTPDQWVTLDASAKRRWPFADQSFDFIFCSHVLEDIRDPIVVCEEMLRVGKAGFIQTPSRAFESTFGIHGTLFPGYMHHRWYLEAGEDRLTITFKSPILSDLPHLACDPEYSRRHDAMDFWWNGSFSFRERSTEHRSEIVSDLIRFKAEVSGYTEEWQEEQRAQFVPPFRSGRLRARDAVWRRVANAARLMRR